jgi:hypothetical protein
MSLGEKHIFYAISWIVFLHSFNQRKSFEKKTYIWVSWVFFVSWHWLFFEQNCFCSCLIFLTNLISRLSSPLVILTLFTHCEKKVGKDPKKFTGLFSFEFEISISLYNLNHTILSFSSKLILTSCTVNARFLIYSLAVEF